jgi:hypothetical protein
MAVDAEAEALACVGIGFSGLKATAPSGFVRSTNPTSQGEMWGDPAFVSLEGKRIALGMTV